MSRGIPIVGRGTSSTMPGTNPLQALLAKERAEERERRKLRAEMAVADPRKRRRRRRREAEFVIDGVFRNRKNRVR